MVPSRAGAVQIVHDTIHTFLENKLSENSAKSVERNDDELCILINMATKRTCEMQEHKRL